MRKFWTLSFLLVLAFAAFGQKPVKWSFSSKKISDKEFDLILVADIQDGWTIYSQDNPGDEGPLPTSFSFEAGSHYTKVGKTVESPTNRKTVQDAVFEMQVTKFYKKATFTQRVKVNDFSKPITGYLEYMTCDDTKCMPPTDVEFSFKLEGGPTTAKPTEPGKATAKEAEKPTTVEPAKPASTTDATPAIQPLPGQATSTGSGENPVTWTLAAQKISETEYDLAFKATVQKGWYLYSQNIEPGGPEPTTFTFTQNPNLEITGKAAEASAHKIEGMDPVFQMKVTKFKDEVSFTQRIKVKDATQTVEGFVTYMTCDDTKCLPPTDVPFKVTPGTLTALIGDAADASAPAAVSGEKLPVPLDCEFLLDKTKVAACGEPVEEQGKGLMTLFLLGFVGGLVALLTPCVFPMIPLTVSFFTKGSGDRKKGLTNAFLYGFFIFAVYLLLSLPFHLLDSVNPDILNDISTNVWLNIFFFVIFIVFAISFFGYFEITLPESWTNKASSAEGVGGLLGIFFMALTLALVSFSCTGPILGSLLAGALSSSGGAWQLTAGMGGFGMALALPFGLFAAFPSLMSSLPKSGGWMTTVKVVLGFIELALALKFLSNADLVKHWGLLKIEPFLVLWIVIFVLLGIYLLGKIRFPHDSKLKKITPTRWVLALLSFGFAIYMMTGLRYDEKSGSLTPLKLLSGLAPPSCYSWFYPCDCPQNIQCFKDFCEGLAYAREVKKPIMIDFTGHACVNCRKMEEHVWPEPEVYKFLKDDYVLISLYVDEKIDLPADQQKKLPMKSGGERRLRTVGHKWAHFQSEVFDQATQPQYVLLSPDGTLLNNPVSYTPDVSEYANWLQCGLDNYKKMNGGR